MQTQVAVNSFGELTSSHFAGKPVDKGLELPDMAGFRARRVEKIVRIDDVAQVPALVRQAVETHTPLYPISTGRNWGLGSSQPVRDGCILVDLGGLKRIRAIDLELGYAVVEAGVTQLDLQEALAGTPFMVNVTGTCAKTSLLGNALERGVGNHRHRTEDLVGL
jgi:4-cresol dehydrogenase (hydroxylating)